VSPPHIHMREDVYGKYVSLRLLRKSSGITMRLVLDDTTLTCTQICTQLLRVVRWYGDVQLFSNAAERKFGTSCICRADTG
jgi:hypothetical protein